MAARFDLDVLKTKTNLILQIDTDVLTQATEEERTGRLLRALKKANIFAIGSDQISNTSRVTLRARNLNKYGTNGHSDAYEAVVACYDDLYALAEPDPTMPALEMSHGAVGQGGRRGMTVTVAWPEISADVAADFATEQARRLAYELEYAHASRQLINELVYVRADRSRMAIVQTNSMGSCSIESDHQDYTNIKTVELGQHNLYSPEQQLICLVGAVGLATADKHGSIG